MSYHILSTKPLCTYELKPLCTHYTACRIMILLNHYSFRVGLELPLGKGLELGLGLELQSGLELGLELGSRLGLELELQSGLGLGLKVTVRVRVRGGVANSKDSNLLLEWVM